MSLPLVLLLAVATTVVFALGFPMGLATVLTWAERRQSAMLQNRVGPNRANIGPIRLAGLLHPVADGIKTIWKEDVTPDGAHRFLHHVGPFLGLFPALVAFAVIPYGETWCTGAVTVSAFRDVCTGGQSLNLFQIADLHVGILFIFAISSLGVYGAVIAGWASRSKFPMLGGLRASAQMISYEVTLGLTVIGILMVFGSVSLQEIVRAQGELAWGWLPRWGILVQPLGAVLFFAAAFAETKRAPFDMPEAESELVAGYFTEYSSLKFAMFSLGEFVEVVLLGAVFVVLFLGGWQVPWLYGDGFHLPHAYAAHALVAGLALPGLAGLWIARTRKSGLLAACAVPLVLAGGLLALTVDWVDPGTHLSLPYWLVQLLRLGAMVAKVVFLCWFQLMVRWTLPRFRYDHVMRLTWRYILPLSLVNILITGLVVLL